MFKSLQIELEFLLYDCRGESDFLKAHLGELFPGCFVRAEARHYRREAESSSKANVRAVDSLAAQWPPS
jgi:hypothetical protein